MTYCNPDRHGQFGDNKRHTELSKLLMLEFHDDCNLISCMHHFLLYVMYLTSILSKMGDEPKHFGSFCFTVGLNEFLRRQTLLVLSLLVVCLALCIIYSHNKGRTPFKGPMYQSTHCTSHVCICRLWSSAKAKIIEKQKLGWGSTVEAEQLRSWIKRYKWFHANASESDLGYKSIWD